MNDSTIALWGMVIQIASIPLISAVIAGLVAFGVCIINNWIANKKLEADLNSQSLKTYKELITAERIKWLNLLRESMAEYLAKSYYLLNIRLEKVSEKNGSLWENSLSHEICKLSFLIKLRLNPNQEDHKSLIQTLDYLDACLIHFLNGGITYRDGLHAEYYKKIEEFSNGCQEVLKSEWELVKKEAKPAHGKRVNLKYY